MSKVICKSAFYEATGPAEKVLQLGDVNISDPIGDEVQVEVVFSGVNPYDVKTRAGMYGEIRFPKIIPHCDGSGVVKKIGPEAQRFKVGDRVWIYNAGWMRDHGTACTLCNLPENFLAHLPNHISFKTGASLGIPALTAASCLLCLNVLAHSTVMITGGAGAVGLFAIQLAKFLNLRVITTVSSEQKAKIALSAGADLVLNKNTPYVGDLLDGLIDVDFGENVSWSIDALKPGSIIAAYASAGNPTPEIPFYKMLTKQINLKPMLVFCIEEEVLWQKAIDLVQRALEANVLKPIIHRIYDLDQIALAHKEVESSRKIGQVLLKMKADHEVSLQNP